jgi:hypothetical protein
MENGACWQLPLRAPDSFVIVPCVCGPVESVSLSVVLSVNAHHLVFTLTRVSGVIDNFEGSLDEVGLNESGKRILQSRYPLISVN